MAEWFALPDHVRRVILEMVFCDLTAPDKHKAAVDSKIKRTHGRLCSHALVCRGWLKFFEARTYRHLFLTQDSLSSIRRLNPRQRKLVHHIWLKIDLQPYDCPSCVRYDLAVFVPWINAVIISNAMWALLRILSSWDTKEMNSSGLTLEISAYSHSDTKHVFRNDLHFDMGLFDDDRPIEQNRPSFTDLKHGWLNGRRDGPPSVSSILRIQGSSRYTVAGYSRLPVADVVTSFVLRRQTRWHIDPDLLEEMIRSFPRLRTLHIEPWRYFDYPGRGLADTKLFKMMSHSLPDTVESFTVFEDFNEDYNTVMFNHGSNAWLLPTELARRPSPNVGRAMARRSQQFKKLAASYVVDAEDFFSATLDATNVCMYSWMHLTSLYLTSRHLRRSTHGTRLSTMLEKAGMAALHMPALRTMHIWNGVKGNVCGFRYEATDESTTIQWRGNWLLHLVPGVVNAWRRVADRWTRKELLVLEPRIAQGRYIGSHAVAMEMLGIHHDVLHPVSFKQIKCETSRYWFNYYSSAS